MEILRKNQEQMLEMKSSVTEMKKKNPYIWAYYFFNINLFILIGG